MLPRAATKGSRRARLLAAAPRQDDLDVLIAGMEKGLEGRRLEAIPAVLTPFVKELRISTETKPSRIRLAIRLGSSDARDRALFLLGDRGRAG